MERARRYVFRPASVASLERRDVPSAIRMPADLRNLSATITGSAHATPLDVAGSGDREVDFSGAGKDRSGRAVGLAGSLVGYDPNAYGALPGTFGSATLKTKRATYRFNLNGPPSDLSGDSGLSNVTFWVSKPRVGAPPLVVARGSMQVHREPGPGGEVFTATVVVSPIK